MDSKNIGNSILGGFFWKFCERFLNQGISFVVSMVLARMLLPEDYGTVAMVSVFINLASVFVNHGFATALIQKKDADHKDFSTMFFCSLACTLAIYGLLYAIAPWVADFYGIPLLKTILRISALGIPLGTVQSIQQAYISRNMLFRKAFVASVISTVASGAVGIGMAWAGFGVWALVFHTLAMVLSNTVVYLFLVPWRPKLEFDSQSAKSMMNFGSRVLAAEFSATFFAEIRSLIVGRVYSSADLAYYNKGYQMPQLINANLSGVLLSVMFPAIANYSDDLQQVKVMAKRSIRMLSYVLVPCMFGLCAVMEPLILFLITDKWAASIPYGQILSIDVSIALISSFLLQILKAIGRGDVILKLEFWKKPVYMLFLILGVRVSVMGLAFGMLAYDIYALIVDMVQIKKYIHYGLAEQLRDILPALALGTVMALLVLWIPMFDSLLLTLLLKVLAGGAVYVGGSIVFRLEAFRYLKHLLVSRILGRKTK